MLAKVIILVVEGFIEIAVLGPLLLLPLGFLLFMIIGVMPKE